MTYEELLTKADDVGLVVREKPLKSSDGRIFNNRIAIRTNIPTSTEKACVLAEEIGHYCTSYGDITRIKDTNHQKQEYRARLYGYNIKIGLNGIVRAFQHGCRNLYEAATFLDVTEEYLKEALNCYKSKYGEYTSIDNYVIYFEPCLTVLELK